MTHVLIGFPSVGHVDAGFAESLARVSAYWMARGVVEDDKDRVVQVLNCQSSLLSQSRSKLLHRAIEGGASHLLTLDSDMVFPPETLDRLLAHDKDVVCVNYMQKTVEAPRPTAEAPGGTPIHSTADKTGLQEAAHAGMGVMLIRIEAVKTIPEPWFPVGWHTGLKAYVGEDVYFTRLLRKHGLRIWVDHDLSREVAHVGPYDYRVQMSDLRG